jgi:hypothetical protein
MDAPTASPLKDPDCDCLNKVLESAAHTRELLEACKDCGVPVDEAIAVNEQQAQLAAKLKGRFFPNRP